MPGLGPVSDASGSAIILSGGASHSSLNRRDSSNKSDDIDFKFIDGHGPMMSFRASPRTPFIKAARRYFVERNLHGLKDVTELLSQIIFKRNGDPMNVSKTVGDMALQDGEQIMVVWSDSLCNEMFQNLESDVIDITE